ncbi:hypothetical protein ABPG77_005995 [Micractinium sp. CCAP 211/92]
MGHSGRLAVLLLAVAAGSVNLACGQQGGQEQGTTAAACTPLTPTPGGLKGSIDNGVTNPLLLSTLVKDVDEAGVYTDSKTIVDMPLKAPPEEVAKAYAAIQPLPSDPQQRNKTLQEFLGKWLLPVGDSLAPYAVNLTEQQMPAWFEELAAPEAQDWAAALFEIWGRLAREEPPAVAERPDLYTLLPVPNPFVVPGARFREVYYWDSYWILEGLIASNLTDLAQDIIGNFIYLIETYGFIPNGIRTYYLNRSQPPLFSEMVKIVYQATGNKTLLAQALPALLLEHMYWTSSPKQVLAMQPGGQDFNVTRYFARWQEPRPESYKEDEATAREAGLDPMHPDVQTQQLYRDLATGAETGECWDFSSRWFADGKNITTIRTTLILPADLNAYMLTLEQNIADFAAELGCSPGLVQQFHQLANERRTALMTLFWNNETSSWHDLVCTPVGTAPAPAGTEAIPPAAEAAPTLAPSGAPAPELQAADSKPVADGKEVTVCEVSQNPAVFASNWVPLWAGATEAGSPEALAAVESLNSSGLFKVGGVATTLTETGQQWDFPNVWPPINWLLIDGLQRFGDEPGAALAEEIAYRFLDTVYATYNETGRMFEKFNATQVGLPGGGGEYEVVDGFGWTNGAVLNLLERYPDWAPGA